MLCLAFKYFTSFELMYVFLSLNVADLTKDFGVFFLLLDKVHSHTHNTTGKHGSTTVFIPQTFPDTTPLSTDAPNPTTPPETDAPIPTTQPMTDAPVPTTPPHTEAPVPTTPPDTQAPISTTGD